MIKIIDNTHKPIPFENLLKGDVFKYDKHWFIKIESITSVSGACFNAVNMCTGFLAAFSMDTDVDTKVNIITLS